jgi:hypothetical protein
MEEYGAQMSNGTWELIPRPRGSNVFIDKWIFTYRFLSDGTFDHYKARWILWGFTWGPRVDYDETFNPVLKLATMTTHVTNRKLFLEFYKVQLGFGPKIAFILLTCSAITKNFTKVWVQETFVLKFQTELNDIGYLD